LVEPPASTVLRTQSWIDEVIVFPRGELSAKLRHLKLGPLTRDWTRFLRGIRRRRFDLVVDFHSILRSGLLSISTGAPHRVAYAPPFGREFAYLFANYRARLRPARMSRFDRNAGLVDYLNGAPGVGSDCEAPAAGSAALELDREAHAEMATRLSAGPSPAVIHPGTSDATPFKRYTTEGYVEIARGLAAETGAPTVVAWGPGRDDRALASAIVFGAGAAARLAPPTPTLRDLAALFACCRLFVGADSGPLHLASGVGIPVVQIIGPTDPVENAPNPSSPSRTVRVGLDCSPCRRGCAAATCMTMITPAAVLGAARELLQAPVIANAAARVVIGKMGPATASAAKTPEPLGAAIEAAKEVS
jgi:ADP-heptose:LPS heptosyltransferase